MRRIITEIDIMATPERVWDVLTDFASYSEWNPFFAAAQGVARTGETLSLRVKVFSHHNSHATVKVRVQAVEAPRKLEWGGGLAIPRLADGTHGFELTATAAGTHVKHYEMLSGALLPFVGSLIGVLERRYRELNQALKVRAERDRT